MGSAFTKPSFDAFVEMLMLEQSKLIDMGILMSSKTKALATYNENRSNQGEKSSTNGKKKKWKQKSQLETTIFLLTTRQFFFQQEGKQQQEG